MKLESNFNTAIRKIVNPNDANTRNKFYVFLVCLGISVFIWFLIALSNESVTTLDYPVVFKNVPSDMVLANKPDSLLTFRIASGGFELLTLRYLSRRKPIEIDLSNLNLIEQNGFYTANYNTSKLSASILKMHNFSEELVSMSPEVLYFRFEPLTGKMVPVVSDLELEFEKQFRLSDSIVFSPSHVKVVGPKHVIDNIREVKTTNVMLSGVNGPVESSCDLEIPGLNEYVVLVPDQVSFAFNVDRFTESKISIPVQSGTEGIKVKTFPETVEITFLVSLDDYKRIEPELFTAVIDVPLYSEANKREIVRLKKQPSFVDVTRIQPEEIEYLVLKQ